MKSLMRTSLVLCAVACMAAGLSGSSAAPPQDVPAATPAPKAQAPTWAEVLGRSIVLEARRSIREAEVSMSMEPVDAGGWRGEANARAVKIEFRRRAAKHPAAVYLLSPWQRLSWKGAGSPAPKIVTVTSRAVVLGPIAGEDYSSEGKKLIERCTAIIKQMAAETMCERGTQIGSYRGSSPAAVAPEAIKETPVYQLKPYYIRIDYPPSGIRPGTRRSAAGWSAMVHKRMLLVTEQRADPKAPGLVISYQWFPPAKIIRTRPRPFDPGEQHLSPDVDLEAEGAKLDLALCRVFDDGASRLLHLDDPDDREKRLAAYQSLLPALKKAVFSYPGHTGPAHAAGESALEAAQRELKDLMLKGVFRSYEKDHWPATLPVYRPELIETLSALPPARFEDLAELLDHFKRYRKQAQTHPGAWSKNPHPALKEERAYKPSAEEVLLAEIGDRIRTVIAGGPRKSVLEVVGKSMPGAKGLAYKGFDFSIHDPLGKHAYRSSGPVEVRIEFTPSSRVGGTDHCCTRTGVRTEA